MNKDRLFLDTVFIQAILNQNDQYHRRAMNLLPQVKKAREVWLTEAILMEVGNALSCFNRQKVVNFIRQCYQTNNMKIDLAAERLIAAERGEEKIAVEIKSFIGTSVISDFHTALGQFLNYRIMLEANEPDRLLYLAVPCETYQTFFQSRFARVAIERYQLKLIVYDPIAEEIVQWIN